MHDRSGPPRAALWILERLPRAHREHVIGDLVEDYHARLDEAGTLQASLWFWRETIAALWSLSVPQRAAAREPKPQGDRAWVPFLSDLQLAARVLRRSPAFVILCSGTLAIGIGATTAIFSIVNPLIIEPLPYPQAARLLMVWERGADGSPSHIGYSSFVDIERQARTLEHMTVIGAWAPVIGGTEPERVVGERVSASYFATLGVPPVLGRGFTEEEDRPGHNQVVVMSDGLWRRRFGADPSIVSRSITVNGAPVTVVGVMAPTFDDMIWPHTEVWRPLGYDLTIPMACRTCRHLQMIARLRPHVTQQAALAELNTISAQMVADHPKDYPAAGMLVSALQQAVMSAYRPVLLAISGAVILILLIAIANVTNLQLARAVRRRAEFAVRTALGARWPELARQLLAEGLLVSVLGGLGGVLVAQIILPGLVRQLPSAIPHGAAIHLDKAALAVAAMIVFTVGVVIGLVPASLAAVPNTYNRLRSGTAGGDRGRLTSRAGLVIGEFALSLMLLVGAGLIGRSLVRLLAVDVGFDPGHLVSFEVNAVGHVYDQGPAVYAYHDRVLAAVRVVPGVSDAALANQIPLAGNLDQYGVEAQDIPLANPELAPSADRYVVSRDFMATMRIPVLRGRGFEPEDFADSASKVVLVGRTLAGQLWPGADDLGKRIRVGGSSAPWRSVVGVVGDIRSLALDAQGTGQFYVPERQWPWAEGDVILVVRVRGEAASVARSVRGVLASIDPTQPIARVKTMDQILAASAAQRRVAMLLFSAFAAVALLLAAGGIYGVLAGNVAERTRELGVRSALGAAPGQIVRMVVGQGLRLATIGTALGLLGAFVLTRFLRALLFEIQPMDPVTYLSMGAILGMVALAACLVPAIRAVRIDPMSALRGD